MYAICNLSIVALRAEASDKSEMISQVLFGEVFEIIEKREKWSYIRLQTDQYHGWIDNKQYLEISEHNFYSISHLPKIFNSGFIEYVSNNKKALSVPLGAELSFMQNKDLNPEQFIFEGEPTTGIKTREQLLQTAFMYLEAPYLWGGKTPFGIDCSGFTQMVYRLSGYFIPRDACDQAKIGEPLSFIEESEVGDLAFFDNEEGRIVHVGMIMQDNHIIHAHGKVRIDRLDHLGILNVDSGRHTHKLRVIKKII